MSRKTIVFIHGILLNNTCWKEWEDYFTAKGFVCHSPPYPFHEGQPARLRNHPPETLKKMSLKDVLQHYIGYIKQLPEEPILIGHSMGGLVVQKLLEQNYGRAGIVICSAPPRGIFTFDFHFFVSNTGVINFFKGNSLFLPGLKWLHYAVCNTLSMPATETIYNKFIVPESRNIPRSAAKYGKINFKNPHWPLLFIGTEKDRITPASLNYKNYKAYTHKRSKKDYKEFKERSHAILWEENWEEVASYCYNWIKRT
jgi:esterase/lipase